MGIYQIMGLVQSNQASQEVTMDRIRTVCQTGKSNKWEADILANDIEKILGVRIKRTNRNGRPESVGVICDRIRTVIPDPESVCMMSSKKRNQKLVKDAVAHYNKYYGANIQLWKNPLDKEEGLRSYSELCDDLYYVGDKVKRQLAPDVSTVKVGLEQEIQRLMLQSKMLDDVYNNPNKQGWSGMDSLVTKDQARVNALTNELKMTVDNLRTVLVDVQDAYKNGILDRTPQMSKNIDDVRSRMRTGYNVNPSESDTEKTLQRIATDVTNMTTADAATVIQITDILQKFGIKLDSFFRENASPELTDQFRTQLHDVLKTIDNIQSKRATDSYTGNSVQELRQQRDTIQYLHDLIIDQDSQSARNKLAEILREVPCNKLTNEPSCGAALNDASNIGRCSWNQIEKTCSDNAVIGGGKKNVNLILDQALNDFNPQRYHNLTRNRLAELQTTRIKEMVGGLRRSRKRRSRKGRSRKGRSKKG